MLFRVPPGITPFDIEVDSHRRIYISDSAANHVYQFDAQGRQLRIYGRLNAQAAGHYDPQTFMAPEKLACWTDAQGQDRLLVVEMAGPNRLSEWSGDSGELLRQWVVPQTHANDGYAIDPRHPDQVYVLGQRDTLVRWKIDYASGQWTPEAVWTHVGPSGFDGKLLQPLGRPRVIYRGDDAYIAFGRGYAVYHLEGDRLRACAAMLVEQDRRRSFHLLSMARSATATAASQPGEYRRFPAHTPPGTLRYFGETWFDDLSLVSIGQYTPDIWRLAPTGFDARGTPLYDARDWRKLLTDEIFARAPDGTATVLRGGNETPTSSTATGLRSCRRMTAIFMFPAAAVPISRPTTAASTSSRAMCRMEGAAFASGGASAAWRSRASRSRDEVYGPMNVSAPLNGLVSVIDNSRAGIVLYDEDGLYVDTLFPDDHLVSHDQMGAYWQPGEFFAGDVYANRDNGKIYLAMGKTMPQIFEAQGWSTTENPVHPLTTVDHDVTLAAAEIAAPARGGAPVARRSRPRRAWRRSSRRRAALPRSTARCAAGKPARPSRSATARSKRSRCVVSMTAAISICAGMRGTGRRVEIRPLGLPEHLFAHDRQSDTLGLYLQGDPDAGPGTPCSGGTPRRCAVRLRHFQRQRRAAAGRAGDVSLLARRGREPADVSHARGRRGDV